MRVLVLDSALGRCAAAIVSVAEEGVDDAVLAARSAIRERGHEALLPAMARDVMAESPEGIGLVGVLAGPGSFTGIRAGLALAHGIGLAAGVPVIGVTVGEAIAAGLPSLDGWTLWTVTEGRRGHVFLERGADALSCAVDALPMPPDQVAIAGGAANRIAARLAARGVTVMLTAARFPSPLRIAQVAARRHAGAMPVREAQPLYIDPPEAKPPAGGPRPPPDAAM